MAVLKPFSSVDSAGFSSLAVKNSGATHAIVLIYRDRRREGDFRLMGYGFLPAKLLESIWTQVSRESGRIDNESKNGFHQLGNLTCGQFNCTNLAIQWCDWLAVSSIVEDIVDNSPHLELR